MIEGTACRLSPLPGSIHSGKYICYRCHGPLGFCKSLQAWWMEIGTKSENIGRDAKFHQVLTKGGVLNDTVEDFACKPIHDLCLNLDDYGRISRI